jgi:hypothetical protein
MAGKDAIESIDKMIQDLIPKVLRALNNTTKKVEAKLLRQHLAGPTGDHSLSKRTGALGRSIRTAPAQAEGTMVSSKITAGVNYARIHFTGGTIKAKKKFLTIPTDFAKTNAGVAKGRMIKEGNTWTFLGMPTFIAKGIIFGKVGGALGRSEGLRQRRAAGEKMSKGTIIPLFTLKNSVVIKRRIDPKVDILQWAKPVLTEELKKAGLVKAG